MRVKHVNRNVVKPDLNDEQNCKYQLSDIDYAGLTLLIQYLQLNIIEVSL